jgi:hypothetical protein
MGSRGASGTKQNLEPVRPEPNVLATLNFRDLKPKGINVERLSFVAIFAKKLNVP